MKRNFTSYPVNNFSEIKFKMLNWLNQFNIFCFLDNHQYNFFESSFECLAGVGSYKTFVLDANKVFVELNNLSNEGDWIFGHLGYDLKNQIESLSSKNLDGILFQNAFFFVPDVVLKLSKDELQIGTLYNDSNDIFKNIFSENIIKYHDRTIPELQNRFAKDEYISTVNKIKDHIHRGDCYELNFCQEFYAEDAFIDPLQIYKKLSTVSPNPFSAFYKLDDKYLLCSSPERYLRKKGKKIFSQPIKGTAKRDLNNSVLDSKNKQELLLSQKERSENVMIVDLVRNDLSKICQEDSVRVDELYGIYSFPQVHQMISTVSGTLEPEVKFGNIIKATFPMGSMTGAPKRKVMELIEKYERTKRGLFSGTVGYINPGGDFDFNVVIRSILYNSSANYLSMQAGSAITFGSNAENEYEECLLKIAAMKAVLE